MCVCLSIKWHGGKIHLARRQPAQCICGSNPPVATYPKKQCLIYVTSEKWLPLWHSGCTRQYANQHLWTPRGMNAEQAGLYMVGASFVAISCLYKGRVSSEDFPLNWNIMLIWLCGRLALWKECWLPGAYYFCCQVPSPFVFSSFLTTNPFWFLSSFSCGTFRASKPALCLPHCWEIQSSRLCHTSLHVPAISKLSLSFLSSKVNSASAYLGSSFSSALTQLWQIKESAKSKMRSPQPAGYSACVRWGWGLYQLLRKLLPMDGFF